MKNSLKRFLTIVFFCLCLWIPSNVKADITFPARLEITEISPGIYDVFFVLPVINGQVLKAHPVFPEGFTILNEPTIEGDNNTKRMTWRVSCDPEKLSGLKIGIDGLLGSPTDVFFKLSLLNGRMYDTKLSPSNAFYIIPSPPTFFSLVKDGFLFGIQTVLLQVAFYILLLVLLPFLNNGLLKKSLLFFGVFSFVGLWLGINQYLVFSKYHFTSIVLLISFIYAFKLLNHPKHKSERLSFLIFSSILGLAFGAILSPNLDMAGLTLGNISTHVMAIVLGILSGFFLMILMLKEFLILLHMLLKKQTEIVLAYTIGILAFGLLVYESSLYFVVPSMLPNLPLVLIIFVMAASFTLKKIDNFHSIFKLTTILIPLAVGISFGFIGIQIPYALNILLAFIWFLFLSYFYKGIQLKYISIFTLILGGILAGFLVSEFTRDSLSFALGQTVGYSLMLLMLATSIISFKTETTTEKSRPIKFILIIGILLSLTFVFFQTMDSGLLENFQTDFTMGLVHIPFLTILFLVLVWLAWPRYKKIHKAMKLERKKPILSVLFLGLALLLIPITIKASNPWHRFNAPTQAEVQQIIQRILSNTYTAFNTKDETVLFTTLSDNLEGSLVDHVYLDSRRRLTMGLKEGAEVMVEDVKVSKIGEEIPLSTTETVFQYPVEWTVTARVRHLQHVHYRQNKYLGDITLKLIDKVWKISNMTLTSEDRTIISANNK